MKQFKILLKKYTELKEKTLLLQAMRIEISNWLIKAKDVVLAAFSDLYNSLKYDKIHLIKQFRTIYKFH